MKKIRQFPWFHVVQLDPGSIHLQIADGGSHQFAAKRPGLSFEIVATRDERGQPAGFFGQLRQQWPVDFIADTYRKNGCVRRALFDQLFQFMKENGIPTDALESGKRKILIVDDDVELVELLVDVFERDGRFDIRTANNGFDAGMFVKEFRPDLVVLDVMLPDINGKEVCQRVRSDSTLDSVKIICISGMVEQDKVADLRAAGADEFIQKPFSVDKLLERSCDLLDIERVVTT